MKKLAQLAIMIFLLTSAVTPLPANAQSAQSQPCPTPRLKIGNNGIVEFAPYVEFRTEPEAGQLIGQINNYYVVIDGPICTASGTLWWKVSNAQGTVGYAPEGRIGKYWVYPEPTQQASVTTTGAFQAFENGYMIWRYDSGGIMIFVGKDGGQDYRNYRNRDYARFRNNPVRTAPPSGLFKPINGFGKLWGNVAEVRQNLGWAIAPEQTYTVTLSYPEPSMPSEHITTADGRTIYTYFHLIRGWSFR